MFACYLLDDEVDQNCEVTCQDFAQRFCRLSTAILVQLQRLVLIEEDHPLIAKIFADYNG